MTNASFRRNMRPPFLDGGADPLTDIEVGRIADALKVDHPLAELFPPLEGEEFDALVADIQKNGLREAIVCTPSEEILDGVNRERACLAAGVEPTYETTAKPPENWPSLVISKNVARRHLSKSQLAALAAEFVTTSHGDNRFTHRDAKLPIYDQSEAAKRFSVSPRYVGYAVKVKNTSQILLELVKTKAVPVPLAAEVADQSLPYVEKFVRLVKEGKSPDEAKAAIDAFSDAKANDDTDPKKAGRARRGAALEVAAEGQRRNGGDGKHSVDSSDEEPAGEDDEEAVAAQPDVRPDQLMSLDGTTGGEGVAVIDGRFYKFVSYEDGIGVPCPIDAFDFCRDTVRPRIAELLRRWAQEVESEAPLEDAEAPAES